MYENTLLNIALNRTCIKDLNKNVLPYVLSAWFFTEPFVLRYFDISVLLERVQSRLDEFFFFKTTPGAQKCQNNVRQTWRGTLQ